MAMVLMMTVREWARRLKRDIIALWIAARDPRVPWHAKAVAGTTAAYALSPLDLIPDFIPVLGYLDDLLIVPAGLWLARKLIPDRLMDEFRALALHSSRPRSLVAAGFIILVWTAVVAMSWAWWTG